MYKLNRNSVVINHLVSSSTPSESIVAATVFLVDNILAHTNRPNLFLLTLQFFLYLLFVFVVPSAA